MDTVQIYTTVNKNIQRSGFPLARVAGDVVQETGETITAFSPQASAQMLRQLESGLHAAPPTGRASAYEDIEKWKQLGIPTHPVLRWFIKYYDEKEDNVEAAVWRVKLAEALTDDFSKEFPYFANTEKVTEKQFFYLDLISQIYVDANHSFMTGNKTLQVARTCVKLIKFLDQGTNRFSEVLLRQTPALSKYAQLREELVKNATTYFNEVFEAVSKNNGNGDADEPIYILQEKLSFLKESAKLDDDVLREIERDSAKLVQLFDKKGMDEEAVKAYTDTAELLFRYALNLTNVELRVYYLVLLSSYYKRALAFIPEGKKGFRQKLAIVDRCLQAWITALPRFKHLDESLRVQIIDGVMPNIYRGPASLGVLLQTANWLKVNGELQHAYSFYKKAAEVAEGAKKSPEYIVSIYLTMRNLKTEDPNSDFRDIVADTKKVAELYASIEDFGAAVNQVNEATDELLERKKYKAAVDLSGYAVELTRGASYEGVDAYMLAAKVAIYAEKGAAHVSKLIDQANDLMTIFDKRGTDKATLEMHSETMLHWTIELAEAYLETGQHQKAIDIYSRWQGGKFFNTVLDKQKMEDAFKPYLLEARAGVVLMEGRKLEAAEMFSEAGASLGKEDVDKAFELYSQAVRILIDEGKTVEALGKLFEFKDKLADDVSRENLSEEVAKGIGDVWPALGKAFIDVGDILATEGNNADALKSYEAGIFWVRPAGIFEKMAGVATGNTAAHYLRKAVEELDRKGDIEKIRLLLGQAVAVAVSPGQRAGALIDLVKSFSHDESVFGDAKLSSDMKSYVREAVICSRVAGFKGRDLIDFYEYIATGFEKSVSTALLLVAAEEDEPVNKGWIYAKLSSMSLPAEGLTGVFYLEKAAVEYFRAGETASGLEAMFGITKLLNKIITDKEARKEDCSAELARFGKTWGLIHSFYRTAIPTMESPDDIESMVSLIGKFFSGRVTTEMGDAFRKVQLLCRQRKTMLYLKSRQYGPAADELVKIKQFLLYSSEEAKAQEDVFYGQAIQRIIFLALKEALMLKDSPLEHTRRLEEVVEMCKKCLDNNFWRTSEGIGRVKEYVELMLSSFEPKLETSDIEVIEEALRRHDYFKSVSDGEKREFARMIYTKYLSDRTGPGGGDIPGEIDWTEIGRLIEKYVSDAKGVVMGMNAASVWSYGLEKDFKDLMEIPMEKQGVK